MRKRQGSISFGGRIVRSTEFFGCYEFSSNTVTPAANEFQLIPLEIKEDITLSEAGLFVNTLSAGDEATLGVYSFESRSSGALRLLNLLGAVSLGTANYQKVDINVTLLAGIYILGAQFKNGLAIVRRYAISEPKLGYSANSDVGNKGLYTVTSPSAYSSGVLPDTVAQSDFAISSNNMAQLMLRRA